MKSSHDHHSLPTSGHCGHYMGLSGSCGNRGRDSGLSGGSGSFRPTLFCGWRKKVFRKFPAPIYMARWIGRTDDS